MKDVEKIFNDRKLVATVLRHKIKVENLKFFTSARDPIQVAIHYYPKKKMGRLQVYKISKPLQISRISKFIYVEAGKINVVLQTHHGKPMSTIILNKGDSIIINDIPHIVNFSANSRAFEIKQGPYKAELKS